MRQDMQKIGRLAMRVEGANWNAYYAMPGTMKGALFLGSINMQFVQTQSRKDAFMGLMKEAVADLLEELTGTRPVWPDGPQPAPEHEKSSSA